MTDTIDPTELATTCDDRFFETFLRAYVRNKLTNAIQQNGLSDRSYSTYVWFQMSMEKATWDVCLSKDYSDERVKEVESLTDGLYEGLRRIDFRTGQRKFLVDQT